MTDDVWRELLRSPFDDDPPPQRSADGGSKGPRVRFAAIGLAIGVLLAGGWLLLAGDDADPEMEAVVTTTTSAPPEVAAEGFPIGYVEVDEGLGARPELMYVQGSDLYVVLSTAVRSDVDPGSAETFKGGEWVVTGGAAPVTATAEVSNAHSLGVVTVRFSAGGAPPSQVSSLLLTPATPRVTYEHELEYPTDGLPFETTEALRFGVDYGDAEIVVDRIAVDANVGVVDWHVVGPDTVRARVDVVVILPDTAGGEDDPATRLVSERSARPFPIDRPQEPSVGHSRGASEVIRRVNEEVEDDDEIASVVVRLTISVQDVVAGEPIEIPLEGVRTLD
jgi:hypothetical protein